jgi:hypothetical protein
VHDGCDAGGSLEVGDAGFHAANSLGFGPDFLLSFSLHGLAFERSFRCFERANKLVLPVRVSSLLLIVLPWVRLRLKFLVCDTIVDLSAMAGMA